MVEDALKVRFLANNDDTNDLEPLNNTTMARAGNTGMECSLRPQSFPAVYMSICALKLGNGFFSCSACECAPSTMVSTTVLPAQL